MLSRDQLLALDKGTAPVAVTVDGWGDGFIKRFNVLESSNWYKYTETIERDEKGYPVNPEQFRSKLVQLTWCDADGKEIFLPNDVFTEFPKFRYDIINSVYLKSVKINNLSDKEVARERENFTATQNSATGTGSL